MASSLSAPNKGSTLTKAQEAVIFMLADGISPNELARKLSKGDERRGKVWRSRMRRWAVQPAFRDAMYLACKGELVLNLPDINSALVRRASRGRPDAVKMVWGASGFHNDKVNHEHSGDIQINVSIPRPAKPSEATGIGPGKDDESYVDADVVDD